MYDAPPNSIFLDGTDLMHLTPAALRQHVGMIFQDFHLFPGTVEYNIALGNPKVNRAAVKRAAAAVQALSFIEALPRGFDTVLDGGGRQLSQGQRQLLAFARVLALNPPVLILDEATAHVDPATEAAIGSALAGAATGRTCVVIAHRLNAVREVDRIAVLERGELVELGTHAQLLARRGAYRALYDAQMRSYEPGS
jgi:ATP-binding cassette subfamily B protein